MKIQVVARWIHHPSETLNPPPSLKVVSLLLPCKKCCYTRLNILKLSTRKKPLNNLKNIEL